MNKPQIIAIEREITRLKNKLKKIVTKIDNNTNYGSELVKAHNNFVEEFNSTTDTNKRLELITSYEKEKKKLESYAKYDVCELIDQQVKIERDIHELECSLYSYKRK